MKDERTTRQIIIDRIEAYLNGIVFYDPELAETYNFDYDVMTDKELLHEFEILVFNHHKIKEEYRKNNPDIQVPRR